MAAKEEPAVHAEAGLSPGLPSPAGTSCTPLNEAHGIWRRHELPLSTFVVPKAIIYQSLRTSERNRRERPGSCGEGFGGDGSGADRCRSVFQLNLKLKASKRH